MNRPRKLVAQRRASADAILASTENLVRLALGANGLEPRHVRDVLNHAIWKRTEAEYGKYRLPLRTQRAHEEIAKGGNLGSRLRHEHVYRRKLLVAELYELRRRPDAALALFRARSVACVVLKEEAKDLDRVDADGWDRYEKVQIAVFRVNSQGVLTPYRTFG
jgi:hypothetical protein